MKILISLFTALLLTSCTGVQFNRSQVLDRETSLQNLQKKMDNARKHDVDILAPLIFQKAQAQLDEAIKEAQRVKDPTRSRALAEQGFIDLKKAEQIADNARASLTEALENRRQAKEAQAHLLYQSEFEVLDRKFKQTSKEMEEGHQQAGVQENARLASAYATLELKSLKADISENASKAYDEAVKLNALRFAPITMKKAKSELTIARKILDLQKGDYEKAQAHAEQALNLANRARYIAEIITGFQKEKLTQEQWVLWYQDQLEQAHQDLDQPLSFSLHNRDVISAFREHVQSQVKGAHKLVDRQAKELSRQKDDLEKLRKDASKPEPSDIFAELSALFAKDEAEVLKRDKDIIIRSYGFQFDIGKSELLQSNYALLNKMVAAVKKFPKATFVVEGHTDSTGSDDLNMRLSQDRATNIRAFLIKVADIDGNRVSSVGYGKEKPVASNATLAGRAENRRIEIVIKQ
jgi:OOP family OmpA-OmpF porin